MFPNYRIRVVSFKGDRTTTTTTTTPATPEESCTEQEPQEQAARNRALSLSKSSPPEPARCSGRNSLQPVITSTTTARGSGVGRVCQRSQSARYQASNRPQLVTQQQTSSSNQLQLNQPNQLLHRGTGASATLSVNNSLASRNNSIFSALGGKLPPTSSNPIQPDSLDYT